MVTLLAYVVGASVAVGLWWAARDALRQWWRSLSDPQRMERW